MKRTIRRVLNGLYCALLACSAAAAQEAADTQEKLPQARMPKKCYANEHELGQCLADLVRQEEATLDGLRVKVRAALEEQQRTPFDELEGAWKVHRRASCEFDSALAAGNSKSSRFAECMLAQTQYRVRVLSRYLASVTTGGCGNGVGLYMIEIGLICPVHL